MREGALLGDRQADRERSREADQREHDVAFGKVGAQCAAGPSARDQGFHERPCASEQVGPVARLQMGMDDVHHPDPSIERGMHVASQCLDTVGNGREQRLARADALFEDMAHGCVKQRLLVGKVAIERADPDPGTLRDRIARRIAAHLKDQLDCGIDEPLPVSLRVSSHCTLSRTTDAASLTKTQAEHIPPFNDLSRSREDLPIMKLTLCLSEAGRNQTALVGGKAASLGELLRMDGVVVPPGFCVTTTAFSNALSGIAGAEALLERLEALPGDDADQAESAHAVRWAIESASLPDSLVADISARLDAAPSATGWAVRSSATAEDSPTTSFAGVHESYLGLSGVNAILAAVRRCWSSAFDDRALAYRRRQGLSLRETAMAVVIQHMVPADASGVLFTADPVSGDRTLVTIEACRGTGEALVSGRIVPQQVRLRDESVVETSEGPLTIELARELAIMGRRIEAHFGSPQDIEWCVADGAIAIVQSRPITTLFPIPPREDDRRHVYLSVGHQQMMTDAMKPLGLSVWQKLAARPMHEAGGQLFVDVTEQLATQESRAALLAMLNRDPLIHSAVEQLVSRDYVALSDQPVPVAAAAEPVARGPAPANDAAYPDPAIVSRLICESELALETAKRRVTGLTGRDLLEAIGDDLSALKQQLSDPRGRTALMAGINATWWLQDHLREWLAEASLVDVLSQSVEHNITSRMGLDLLDVADAVRPHDAAVTFLRQLGPEDPIEGLASVAGGRTALDAIDGFLARYGMRCPGEIDITRTRWREQPAKIIPMILANLDRFAPGEATRRFDAGLVRARAAERDVLLRLATLDDGSAKVEAARAAIDRMRAFIGYREYPKYAWVCRLDVYRRALLEEAERLVERSVIERADDIFYLRFDELGDMIAAQVADWGLIAERRAEFAVYEHLTPPRVLTSDGEALFGSFGREVEGTGVIPGLAVSSGVAEGRARVILDPAAAELAPGDILVTAYTDPSWTPLFLTIAGLVTEAGGQMSHGAVVAREYGLPAIVAVQDATRRIQDGQFIRIDGSSGSIRILDGHDRSNPAER